MRLRTTMVTVLLLGLAASLPAAGARGGHRGRFHGHHGLGGGINEASRNGGAFASDQRHANDDYVNAAAQEEDKLLDSKIKSICRGC